jgi:DNA-binding NtrC family response regulator
MAHEFVQRAAARMGKDVRTVSADAMTLLVHYEWPGDSSENQLELTGCEQFALAQRLLQTETE